MNGFIGKYPLEAQIGSGGHSVVYRSIHPVLQRPVAVKVLHGPSAHDAEARSRFLREAQLVLELRHPGIVPLYDVGDSDDGLFLVTELYEHGSLAQLLERGRLTLPQALAVSIAIADAIAYAHSRGVVHGDIKPSNVLLRADGTPVVADFGSAEEQVTAAVGGQPSRAHGTPAYCAPELFEGQPGDVRSDVYSFGVLVYELLAGRLPFEGTPHEMMYAHLRTPPPPLHTLAPHIPLELSLLVEQLLAKQRSSRPADMAAIAARLGAIAADRVSPNAAAQAAPAHRPARKPAAYRSGAALGATVQLPLATAAPQPGQPTAAPAAPPNRRTIAYSRPPGTTGGQGRAGWLLAVVGIFITLGLLMLPRTLADIIWKYGGFGSRPAYEPPLGYDPALGYEVGAMPTATLSPTPTPETVTFITVEPLPEPLQTLPRRIAVDNENWSVGSVGVYQDTSSIRVYGVLRNLGEHERANPTVRVILRDASGVELAANDAEVQGSSLPPGGYGGFRTAFVPKDRPLPETYQYTLDFEVRSDAATSAQRAGPATQAVEYFELEHELPDEYRWNATVFDQAIGVGTAPAHAIFYDNSGAVVGLDTGAVGSTKHYGAGYPAPAVQGRPGYPAPASEVVGEYPAPSDNAQGKQYILSGVVDFMEHAPARVAVIPEYDPPVSQQR